IELSVRRLGLGEETFYVLGLGDVRLNGDRLASVFVNAPDDSVGSGLAAGVVDNDRGSLCRQMLGDRSPDSFGCPRYDCDLSFESVHSDLPFSFVGYATLIRSRLC